MYTISGGRAHAPRRHEQTVTRKARDLARSMRSIHPAPQKPGERPRPTGKRHKPKTHAATRTSRANPATRQNLEPHGSINGGNSQPGRACKQAPPHTAPGTCHATQQHREEIRRSVRERQQPRTNTAPKTPSQERRSKEQNTENETGRLNLDLTETYF